MSSARMRVSEHSVTVSAMLRRLRPDATEATAPCPTHDMATRHPPGLYVLFFTELWERYSFYSMMAILSLYMNEALHFDVAHVGRVYGLYNAGVYIMPVVGGLLADRLARLQPGHHRRAAC